MIAVIQSIHNAVSWYRSAGVLPYLGKWKYQTGVQWHDCLENNIVYLGRPADPGHPSIMKICKQMGVKTWIDYDDDLLNIPPENPAHSHYKQKEVQENIKECVKLADLITVSTPSLQTVFGGHVVRNRVNDYAHPVADEVNNTEIVLWRGSPTHDHDVKTVLEDLKKLRKNGIKVVFWGTIGKGIQKELGIECNPVGMPNDYFHALYQLKPSVVICPLVENHFNRGKSNIAYLEATQCGAAFVGPGFAEFENKGVNYKPMGFYNSVVYALEFRKNIFEVAKKDIQENYLLSKSTERAELLTRLTGESWPKV